ncbi:class I SAM-dependent methyltransferase [Pseudalkalibacillus caeni]|uniref:Class I SAM-dependent methyltransferase n=1 Tax=Exobacillus caeni TaxID=2574798 RepID=A0A5R9F3M0_9BACL|nr:class I SAM-dependent methyltransferase [Pseudalkalibacillus caeni]TLS36936.1 class I SAM-dependent methyltransferase [Pseudalkalibacillus caeni]
MINSWNKIIYRIWSPVYDKVFNAGLFLNARKEIFRKITLLPEHKILFVGVGTGADLELIDYEKFNITAIDFSADMLVKAKAKDRNGTVKFFEMDAQDMGFDDQSFDFVFAHLILSVVPDAPRCFREMERLLKPNGVMVIFDKFAPDNKALPFHKRLLRPIISVLGTDIGIAFKAIFEEHGRTLTLQEDSPIMLNGMYRKIVLRKAMN